MPNNKTNNSKQPLRQRSRQPDGTFKGDAVPGTNEAWVPTEAEAGLEKEIKYTVKPKVTATTPGAESAGKYGQKPKIVPTFGTVTTTSY